MSSNDIDRVLANIRKLVSVEEDAQAGSRSRLVLTADLRVDQAQPAPEGVVDADDVVATDAGWPDLAPPEPTRDLRPTFEVATEGGPFLRSLEDRIADLQAAIGQDHPATGFEPDGSEDTAQHRPDRVPFARTETPAGPLQLTPSDMSEADEDDRKDLSDSSGPRFFHSAPGDRLDPPRYVGRDDPLEPTEEEPLLDEDALRDLVAEIVREELAGALGERITRNVRKLVRREIMRTLSTRDFE